MRTFRNFFFHIVRDEKFIDSAYRDFEVVAPNQNIFLIIGPKKPLTYIKSAKIYFVRPRIVWIFAPFSHLFSRAIIFHSIGSIFEENLILRINSSTKIAWISWGYDLYPRIKNIEEFLLPKTKKFFRSISSPRTKLKSDLKSDFKNSFKVEPSNSKLMSRIDFISPVLKSEFDLLSEKFNIPSSKYLRWNYLTLEEDVIRKEPKMNNSGKSLLLGNSGSIWLNHLDILDDLNSMNLDFDEVILPCSYGDREYISFMKEIIKDKLQGVQLIENFLPYDKYIKILEKCKYLLINTERQIALGNILFFLYYGGSVIIRKNNPIVRWIEELDIPFNSMDNSEFISVNGGNEKTKTTLLSYWGKETKVYLTINFLSEIAI